MEQSLSRLLVEVAVKTALKNIKENPGRGIRNIVDMALQCTEGRFQQRFFSTAQTMLQNENSAYYGLVQDTVSHTDTTRLLTFGMAVGYNACTIGAQRIRENEAKMHCNIPWTVILGIDGEHFEEREPQYQEVIRSGERLGIYVWMLFPHQHPQALLKLAQAHPDSAFCIFCEDSSVSPDFLDAAEQTPNAMLVARWDHQAAELCAALQQRELLYSVWCPYGPKDVDFIGSGALFRETQKLSAAFTALVPEAGCPEEVRRTVHRAAVRARDEQKYHTIPWEMQGDSNLVDSIISDDACTAYFDEAGTLHSWNGNREPRANRLFQDSLADIFLSAFPKVSNGATKATVKLRAGI